VKKLAISCLCLALCTTPAMPLQAAYGDENPFVEAMLRMMEVFGLIDRGVGTSGIPYLPGGGLSGLGGAFPGAGGLGGMSPMGGWTGIPGAAAMPYTGMSGMPGMAGVPGMSGIPGMSGVPGMGWPGQAWPGGSMPGYGWPSQAAPGLGGNARTKPVQDLDGIWELTNGSLVMIKGRAARLFVSREKYQDFVIGYDSKTFWWSPRGGNTTTHYRYQMRDGRMVLRDNGGKTLLMRRRN
jgi:hypothetical protein